MSASTTLATLQPSIVLVLAIACQVSCSPSRCTQQPTPRSSPLEFRIVLTGDRCGADCEVIEISSLELGSTEVSVHREPDLVLQPQDVISIVPRMLSGIDPEHPDVIVWTGTLKLTPKAAERVRGLGRSLPPEEQILISGDGEPLGTSYSRLVGQMMSVGEFPRIGALSAPTWVLSSRGR